jgi:hypothetical protein
MRNFVGIALAVSLSACATMESADQPATLKSAVYVAGDRSAPVQPAATPDTKEAAPKMKEGSGLKRLYWFLSGR